MGVHVDCSPCISPLPPMQSRHILLAVGAIALAAVAWFVLSSGEPAGPSAPVIQSVTPDSEDAPVPSDDLADIRVQEAVAKTTREAAAVEALVVEADEEDHPWAGMLAGLTGRLVEPDGTPVVAMRVELIEADASLLFSAEHGALGADELEIGESFTDAEGRFMFEGARDGSFHAFNIDRGGGRATLRLVEQSVEHGGLTDVGDIVMEEFGTLIGTVIDEDGEPVPGARVRATVIPDIAVQTGVLDVREGVVVTGDDADAAFELPPSAFAILERLPIPTTTTLEDGSFRLEGVPIGMVSGGVDMEGHVAARIGPINMTPTEIDVGELELLFGRTVTGSVKNLLGEPVPGVTVCAGALHPVFDVAIMQPAGVTDELGQFSVQGIPEEGNIVGAMKRHRSEPWVVGKANGAASHIDFVLPVAGKVICTVVDEESEPVTGADVRLRLAAGEDNEMSWMMNIAFAGRMPMQQTTAKPTETPGVYIVENLAQGKWTAEVRAPGRGVVREEFEHEGSESRVTVRSPKGQMIRVAVIDEVTGDPLPKAHATLLGPEGFLFTALASGFTGKDGTTSLGPLAPEWREDAMSDAVWMKETVVSVEHPLYGTAKTKVEEGVTEVTIAMPPACTIQGAVSWGGGPPGDVYMVMLRWNDDSDAMAQAMMLPRTAITNLEGRFKITGLAPGAYEVYLMERYFDGNPFKNIIEQKEPTMVDKTEVVADPEAPAEMVFELSPEGLGPAGSFAGRVTVDDNPIAGAEIKVGRRDPDVYFTDGNGQFETDEYPVIRGRRIVIMADVPTAEGGTERQEVYNSWRTPKEGEVLRIDVELSFTPIKILVVDAQTGAPVPGVNLRLNAEGSWRGRRGGNKLESNSRGEANTVLPDKKTYSVVATSKLYAQASAKVSSATLEDGSITIELKPEVPCAGRIVLPADAAREGKMYLNVTSPGFEGDWAPVDAEELTFELSRMSPGDYEARIWSGPQNGMLTTSFTLMDGGDTGLLLEFVAEQEDD